jgi:multidrug efflux pump
VNVSAPFIKRPVATTLLMAAITLAGAVAFRFLPVAPLPQVEFPTIQVSANLPGASPETMASSVATPLERQFGRIAGVTEMTSSSRLGGTNITLQFDLNRNIDAAGRDVQAAINAARSQLPTALPRNPSYNKVNPADAPILILALTSNTYTGPRIYDAADSILAQKVAQVDGVGEVFTSGGARPAVRVELNPLTLSQYGLSTADVRNALGAANANRPVGELSNPNSAWRLATTDQLFLASEYKPLLVAYRNGNPVRLQDVAEVTDSVEDSRTTGLVNGRPAVQMFIFRQPNANIISTVDAVRSLLPFLANSIPPGMNMRVAMDRTTTIRASVEDVEFTLLISIVLVILVVFAFLRKLSTTLIPSIVVPVSLIGTFGVMYLLGYSIDNLSLMALTISTGFVVDDAIVVIENITRYIEGYMAPMEAALKGSREIGFTVLSMSLSLVAVFIPILLMGGIIGRIFREFAVTLAVAVLVSLVVSLTLTPMMCARLLKPDDHLKRHNWAYRVSEAGFELLLKGYARTLAGVLRHPQLTMVVLLLTICLNLFLVVIVPKGFFPQQDTGRVMGSILASQDISFAAMSEKVRQFSDIVLHDPAVNTVSASTGGGGGWGGAVNTANMFIQLKPLAERKATADEVINRLREKLAHIPGATLFLQAAQDIRVGGRQSNAQYQYTLQSDSLAELNDWAPRLLNKIRELPELRDQNSDQQIQGLEANLVVDRDTAGRLGVSSQMIDDALYDAFGQRQVSTMYKSLNQYHVVMEVAPAFQQNPDSLKMIYVKSSTGAMVPLSTFTHYEFGNTQLAVNHQGVFPSITLSFNLAPGIALSQAEDAIYSAQQQIGLPGSVHGNFAGTAQAYQASLRTEPWLILAALVSVYIVLGILYESYIHPITILSTLPSAGVGAFLALLICKVELSVIALIGIILLIGIVKKNAILMIDFALQAEREGGLSSRDAIYQAGVLRFRPILMTTMAALLGALPLAVGMGTGSELRRPLGITIVGGLIVSQILTLYTTPVVYLYLDRLSNWVGRRKTRSRAKQQEEVTV